MKWANAARRDVEPLPAISVLAAITLQHAAAGQADGQGHASGRGDMQRHGPGLHLPAPAAARRRRRRRRAAVAAAARAARRRRPARRSAQRQRPPPPARRRESRARSARRRTRRAPSAPVRGRRRRRFGSRSRRWSSRIWRSRSMSRPRQRQGAEPADAPALGPSRRAERSGENPSGTSRLPSRIALVSVAGAGVEAPAVARRAGRATPRARRRRPCCSSGVIGSSRPRRAAVPEDALGCAGAQDLVVLLDQAGGRAARDLAADAAGSPRTTGGSMRETEPRGERDRPQHPHRVLAESLVGIADRSGSRARGDPRGRRRSR